MHISLRPADLNCDGQHAAHAVCEAGHVLSNPVGVADNDDLCTLKPGEIGHQCLPEAHGRVLFFTFKDEADVERKALAAVALCALHHLFHSKNEGQHGSLVVGATPPIQVLVDRVALKGVRLPVRLLCWLDVIVPIECDCGFGRVPAQPAYDNWVFLLVSPHKLYIRAQRLEQLAHKLCGLQALVLQPLLRAHRLNTYKLVEALLKLLVCIGRLKSALAECAARSLCIVVFVSCMARRL
mmetsp:Transcript_19047/g.53322  ORF Transcript_19047/g.53322 Transcript_19047/m.53322 type:complete len:239 (-) Transcript_19047:217-933(-)